MPPIEKPPKITMERWWHPQRNNGRRYRVGDFDRKTKEPETWETVAHQFDIGVSELIHFNFLTIDSKEVNYYLRTHTGCNKESPSGNNWAFSSSANPGIIFIPPEPTETWDFDEEELEKVCVWAPGEANKFLRRLYAVSQGIPGWPGKRIKRIMHVVLKVGYPKCKELWYYNDLAIASYVNWASDVQRKEMTKESGGAFEFRGDSGTHGQWQIFPVAALFDEFACGASFDVARLKHRLESIHQSMFNGWRTMKQLDAKAGGGAGAPSGTLVWDFNDHIKFLSKKDKSLYWAFGAG